MAVVKRGWQIIYEVLADVYGCKLFPMNFAWKS